MITTIQIPQEYQSKQSKLPTTDFRPALNYTRVPNENVIVRDIPNKYSTENLLSIEKEGQNIISFNSNIDFFKSSSSEKMTFVLENQQSQIAKRLNELISLENGWDGYEGIAVSEANAKFAINLLNSFDKNTPKPSIVPGSDGTLQIEWHVNSYDLEIDILSPYDVVVSRFDHMTTEFQEKEFKADLAQVVEWVADLSKYREL